MLKIDYRNPMAKTFQYEYALYLLMSELFHDVHCSSVFALETLKLYYMDLVSTGKSGYPSYEIQYSRSSKFSNSKKVLKSRSSKKVKIRKLTSKKSYYVRIRTYKTISGKKYYSDWSSKKKVKVK